MLDYAQRANTSQANADSLSAVLAETRILIPPTELRTWRPTTRTRGELIGCRVGVTCVATDGNRAIFVTDTPVGHSCGTAFVGHVQQFWWAEPQETRIVTWSKEKRRHMIFTVVKDHGAPPALHGAPKTQRTVGARPKSLRRQLIDSL